MIAARYRGRFRSTSKRVRAVLAVWMAAAAALCSLHQASAQPAGVRDRDRARALFDQGNEQFRRGRIADARHRYLLAWRLVPSFDIACNLGRAEAELELWADAAEHLAYCLEHFAASAKPEFREAEGKFRDLLSTVRRREARALAERGECDQVVEKVRGALELQETPSLSAELARCEALQGELVAALAHYDRSVELSGRGEQDPELLERIRLEREALRQRIPSVSVHVPPWVPIERAEVDGQRVSLIALRNRVYLDPGPHRLEIVTPAAPPAVTEFELAEGEHRLVDAEAMGPPRPPIAFPSAPVPSRLPAESERSSRDWVLVGEAALSVAALAVGVGYAVAAASASDRSASVRSGIRQGTPLKSACVDPAVELTGPCAELRDAEGDESRYADIATAGFFAAGVGAIGTLCTAWLWRHEQPSSDAAIGAGPGGWSIRYRATF